MTIAFMAMSPLREATTSAACFSWYQPTAAFNKRIPIMTPRSTQSRRPAERRTAISITADDG